MAKAYKENGTDIKVDDYKKLDTQIDLSDKKISFKDAFLQYTELIKSNPHAPALRFLEQLQPLIKVLFMK